MGPWYLFVCECVRCASSAPSKSTYTQHVLIKTNILTLCKYRYRTTDNIHMTNNINIVLWFDVTKWHTERERTGRRGTLNMKREDEFIKLQRQLCLHFLHLIIRSHNHDITFNTHYFRTCKTSLNRYFSGIQVFCKLIPPKSLLSFSFLCKPYTVSSSSLFCFTS